MAAPSERDFRQRKSDGADRQAVEINAEQQGTLAFADPQRLRHRRRDPDHQHSWAPPMEGRASPWDAAAATLGDAPRMEILDLLHATGYLWEAVHVFHDPSGAMALKWMKPLVLGLLSGMGAGVIRWLRYHLAEQGRLPAASYPIASGVIEGAHRHVVKNRMERAGMHWTLSGAQALLNLRCVALNDEWEPFMNHHISK